MKTATLEKLIWVLLYGGLLTLSLAMFVNPSDAPVAHVLRIGGGLAAVLGVVLIYVRSRRKDAP